jgi:hypothetical protein
MVTQTGFLGERPQFEYRQETAKWIDTTLSIKRVR